MASGHLNKAVLVGVANLQATGRALERAVVVRGNLQRARSEDHFYLRLRQRTVLVGVVVVKLDILRVPYRDRETRRGRGYTAPANIGGHRPIGVVVVRDQQPPVERLGPLHLVEQDFDVHDRGVPRPGRRLPPEPVEEPHGDGGYCPPASASVRLERYFLLMSPAVATS